MSYFGVTGSMSLCSSHIHSNPVTIVAIQRQVEKARLQSPEYLAELKAQEDRKRELAIAKAFAEEIWHAEFQASIMLARKCYEEANSSELMDAIISKYREVQIGEEPTVQTNAARIIREGARLSGFKVEEIKGNRRYRPLVKVRQALMAEVYVECPRMSLPQIGRAFGGRDHTTVLHAIVKMGVRRRSGTGFPGARGMKD